jgi:ABC-type phosphate transport system substrate-binding protein
LEVSVKGAGMVVLLVATLVLRASVGVCGNVVPIQALAPPRATARTPWEGLAIVVNRRNPITNLSFTQLRRVFLGEKHVWPNGRRVVLAGMRRGSPERQTILRVIYKMDDATLDKYFLYQVFKGETSTSPTTLQTPADVKKFVVSTPGAMGYLRASDVDDSVKVVRVNGLLPEEDGYPLRVRARQRK